MTSPRMGRLWPRLVHEEPISYGFIIADALSHHVAGTKRHSSLVRAVEPLLQATILVCNYVRGLGRSIRSNRLSRVCLSIIALVR